MFISTLTDTDFQRRFALLAEGGIIAGGSVEECMADAFGCLVAADAGQAFPAGGEDTNPLRWRGSAERWLDRAASHAWGFALPAAW